MAKIGGWWAIALMAGVLVACSGGEITEAGSGQGGQGGTGGSTPQDAGLEAGDAGVDPDAGFLDANPPVCGDGTYATASGTCAPCSGACDAGKYQSAACTADADRVCSVCSGACGDGSFESAACTAAADRVCKTCSKPCDVGSFESVLCTPTSDRVCTACTALTGCASVTCTTASDASCTSCADGYTASAGACIKLPTEQAYLKAPNAEAGDLYGNAVALSGDSIVVGAVAEASGVMAITNGPGASSDNTSAGAGAAYVLRRTGTTWTEEAYLKPNDTAAGDHFGSSVAIAGDTAVVGAPVQAGQGAVYVFVRTGSTWAQQAVLKASNADTSDGFGHSVSIAGDTVVVGAPAEASNQTTITNGTTASSDNSAPLAGAVYVFKRTNTTWAQQAYLKASDAAAGQFFGLSVSIDADTVAVGASGVSNQTGAAYVFVRNAGVWSQQSVLNASSSDPGDNFGVSVGVSGDTVVVGANGESSQDKTVTNGTSASTDNSLVGAGAAYVFHRAGTTWSQEAFLKAANSDTYDNFGYRVAIAGDAIVVAANSEDSSQTTCSGGSMPPFDNDASGSGAAYLFTRSASTWVEMAYLKAANAGANDAFGSAVGLTSDTIVVGASSEASNQTTVTNGPTASTDDSAAAAGAVYVLAR